VVDVAPEVDGALELDVEASVPVAFADAALVLAGWVVWFADVVVAVVLGGGALSFVDVVVAVALGAGAEVLVPLDETSRFRK